jgi:hypothetical protein
VFEIDETPYPASRIVTSKYNEMFSSMRPGQCIKTEPENIGRIAGAMRKWIANKGRTDVVVRIVSKMDDGFGRVYMMPVKPPKMADLPRREIKKLDLKAV